MPEIVAVYQHDNTPKLPKETIFGFVLQLYREDLFFADKHFEHLSLEPEE